jgi:hypothetical protein
MMAGTILLAIFLPNIRISPDAGADGSAAALKVV